MATGFACAVAALIAGHTALSALTVVTFLLSLNFWSKAEYGVRRSLDFLCACSALVLPPPTALGKAELVI